MHMEIILSIIQDKPFAFQRRSFFPSVFALRIGTILENWLPLILKNELVHADSALGNSAAKWQADISWVAWPNGSSWALYCGSSSSGDIRTISSEAGVPLLGVGSYN